MSRTVFAMAKYHELPSWLGAVHLRHKTPYRAELAVAAVVLGVVLVTDVRGAIGFSSFGVLIYYGIANASAYTQPDDQRRWPRWLQVLGLLGCAVLAFSLPPESVAGGLLVLSLGSITWLVRSLTDTTEGTKHG